MQQITIGELFAGIGGFGLGLERAIPNAEVVWQVESDPFCLAVLEKHWPAAKRYKDIRWFPGHIPEEREKFAPWKPWNEEIKNYEVDIITAGFPCQGASQAGKQLGLADHRTALWWEVVRICRVLRPPILILENVPRLATVRGGIDFQTILGSIAELGYDAEWGIISAQSIGAPHRRDRLFIVAASTDADDQGQSFMRINEKMANLPQSPVHASHPNCMAHPSERRECPNIQENGPEWGNGAIHGDGTVKRKKSIHGTWEDPSNTGPDLSSYWQAPMPTILGVDDGIPNRIHRYRALGNAIVPQCAEYLGRRLVDAILRAQS